MKHILTVLFFSLSVSIFAQDTHFTQFYAAPLTLNPALTGVFDGKYRFSIVYRDQWRKTLEQPYKTFAAGLDLRFPLDIKRKYKDAASVGLLFFSDNVPGVDFTTNQIGVSGAFHKSLSTANNQYLSLGVQVNLAQRSVNYEDLTFNDQFDGTTGYTDVGGELLPSNNFAYSDFSVGLNYSYSPKRGIGFFAGAALHHILEPQVSFYYDRDNILDDPAQFGSNKLFRKISGQLSVRLPITDRLDLSPRAIIAIQGPHTEINAGTNIRFSLGEFSKAAFHLGGWLRPVTNEESSFDLDAVVVMVGFELNNFLLGLSYDITLNDLTSNRQGQGAFEVSIAYLGEYENETILCPKF